MQKITGFLVLISFLFATTSVDELLKIPLLINHYSDHKVIRENTSIANYLYEHYVNESIKDTKNPDRSKDSRLPYKSDEISYFNFNLFILTTVKSQPFLKPIVVFFKSENYVPVISFNSSIWQPPRFSFNF